MKQSDAKRLAERLRAISAKLGGGEALQNVILAMEREALRPRLTKWQAVRIIPGWICGTFALFWKLVVVWGIHPDGSILDRRVRSAEWMERARGTPLWPVIDRLEEQERQILEALS